MAPKFLFVLTPQPLVEELIRPTTLEWISEEPENPLAFRWAGVYCNGRLGRTESLLS